MRSPSSPTQLAGFLLAPLALVAGAGAQSGPPIFPAPSYAGGPPDDFSYPRVVAGDIGSDGFPDVVLVVGSFLTTSSSIHVQLGDARGGLGPPTVLSAGFDTQAAIGDVTGDGRDDLVVGTLSLGFGPLVWVFRANAQGQLAPLVQYPGGGALAVGDVTGDSAPDVVLVQNAQVCVLAANAQGTLDPAACYPLSGTGFAKVALGDVDGDGRIDVVAGSSSQLCVLRGNAQGTLDPPACIAVGASDLRAFAAGDVTGDGRLDVLRGNAASNRVCLFAGNALGTFDAPVCVSPGPGLIRTVAVGDASGDGRQDVLVGLRVGALDSGTVNLLRGNAGGTLDAPIVYLPGLVRPDSIAVTDLAADGRMDVVLGNIVANEVCVLGSDGQGGLEAADAYETGANGDVAVGDVSGDGLLDVVQSRDSDDSVCVLKGNLQGTLDPPVCHPAGGNPGPIATGELSGDAFLDVAVSTGADVCVLLGNAQGSLDPAVCYPGASGELAVGDVSGDGRGDLVVSTSSGACVLLGNAQGTLDPAVCTAVPKGFLALGDVTGDGRRDVVVAQSQVSGGQVFVLAGNAQGGLDPAVGYPVGTMSGSLTGVAVGDVDGDGRADVVVTRVSGPGGGETCVLLGNAQGTLDPAACEAPDVGPLGVQLGDVNDDGVLDVVEGSYTADNDGTPGGIYVGVREGGIQGGLGPLKLYASGGNGAGSLALGDVDRDGLLDAIVPGPFFGAGGSGVCVLGNRRPRLGNEGCPGDACPCGNDGVGERGCQNSASTGGARLEGSGVASLAGDTARLSSSSGLPSSLTLFIQGNAAIPATSFGDGLRCAGGALKRLYSRNASLGACSAPLPGDPSISARSAILGDTLSPGDMRIYQTQYRDPSASFCPGPTGGTFNSTNAIVVTWTP